jgi:hypothetical protein
MGLSFKLQKFTFQDVKLIGELFLKLVEGLFKHLANLNLNILRLVPHILDVFSNILYLLLDALLFLLHVYVFVG